ncbi:MAG: hypothetical protein HY855_25495 [Burkholderiales bacterium]|nr:hypothetical protein [Burkholderiales bacterium]
MIAAIWIITAILVGLWSFAGWGAHTLVVRGVSWAGDLKPLLDQLPYGAVVERWFPGWQDALKLAIDLMQQALAWLGGAAPLLVWAVWGVGTAVMLIGAGVLTAIIALVRKNSPPPVPPGAQPGPGQSRPA